MGGSPRLLESSIAQLGGDFSRGPSVLEDFSRAAGLLSHSLSDLMRQLSHVGGGPQNLLHRAALLGGGGLHLFGLRKRGARGCRNVLSGSELFFGNSGDLIDEL